MAFKVFIVTISILIFLVFTRHVEETKEKFISNLRTKKEHFENISIKNVHSDLENNEEGLKENGLNENGTNENGLNENGTNENGLNENGLNENGTNKNGVNENGLNENGTNENGLNENGTNENGTNENKKCDGKKPEGECLFGCDDNGASKYTKEESKMANLEDMMKTFEQTEKICEAIEKKDKERKDKEAVENLEKQLQLNKKFLIQQKAQNKQIEDLQNLIKAMHFDEDMKKVAVEKCSGKADDCLSNKEKDMSDILKMKEARKQNMKINLNIDPFGEEFQKKLMESLKLPKNEIGKILSALQNGEISLDELIKASNGNNINGNNINGNNIKKKGIDGKGTQDSMNYNKECSNCKLDLKDYIDRCKIPCKNCRDPAWKCPQDIKK